MNPDAPHVPRTEQRHPASVDLSTMSTRAVVELMHAADVDVEVALAGAGDALARAADAVAASVRTGGRLLVVGAGTGGRIAIQEVSELPPTFGIGAERTLALVASGAPVGPAAVARSEDDTDGGSRALDDLDVGPADTVIGLAASGTTPFVVATLRAARERGATTVGLANNPATPVLEAAEIPVLLDTGPEILTGSTRLKAGTAQKIALNRITTAAMVAAGAVRSNHMTSMRVTNAKLRARAVRIVADLTGAEVDVAERALRAADWSIETALARVTPGR